MSEATVPDNFTVTIGGEVHHIKMTFGLVNELVRTVGDVEAVAEISFNSDLRNAVLNEVFAKRDEYGVITKPVNLFLLDVDPDAIVDVLEWVGSHVTDFLLKQMIRTKKIMDSRQPQIEALMPTSTGSPS